MDHRIVQHDQFRQPHLNQTAAVPGLGTAIDSLRERLIDVGKRNRLINAPVGKNRSKQLGISDDRFDEIFSILYLDGKEMSFASDGRRAAPPPKRTAKAVRGQLASSRLDTKLRTELTRDGLHKRLLALYRGARTLEEEQGISVLFLAVGFLRWFESESSDVERFAPLVLLPVKLERKSVRSGFRVAYRDQDLEPNLSLQMMLKSDFDLELPDFPEHDWLPSEYFEQVRRALSSKERWTVEADTIELSFYSFAKFLMWKDLDPGNDDWGETAGLGDNDLLNGLLVSGFESGGSIFAPDEKLDERFPDPRELGHILDADASQTQAIAAVQAGRNLVVQGPPGTGKSQTITNIIGVAVREGKRVLFVAEKRAALDVVHDRLEKCGLGPLCLELHSSKANRKQFYADFKRTLDLGRPSRANVQHYEEVKRVRDTLNAMSDLLHQVDAAAGETPYGIIGRIAELVERECPQVNFRIPGADSWARDEFDERLRAVEKLADLTQAYGSESRHIWRGARKRLTPIDRVRLASDVGRAKERLAAFEKSLRVGGNAVSLPDASTAQDAEEVAAHLDALSAIPSEVPGLLESRVLLSQPGAVLRLCEDVRSYQLERAQLLEVVVESALDLRWDEVRMEIAARGHSLFRVFSGSYRQAVARLRSVQLGMLPKRADEQLAQLDQLLAHAKRRQSIGKRARLGRDALGQAWRHDETNLNVKALLPSLRWIETQARRLGSGISVKRQLEAMPRTADLKEVATDLRAAASRWIEVWQRIESAVDLEVAVAFGKEQIESVGIDEIKRRLEAWSSGMERIEDWHRLSAASRHAAGLGLDEVRHRIADRRVPADRASDIFQMVRAEAVWDRMRSAEPALEGIDGAQRHACIERFKDLDLELQTLASQEVALQHYNSIPPGSAGYMGILRGEVNKKTRHMPIRRLLDKAGEAVAMIKPVFLMSPLSVAQFLKRGGLTFDLLLIDEASQVRPADAMGALLRARQIVVVGDQKQMPPTSFFDRQVGSEDGVDYDDEADIAAAQVGDMESILSLCEARSMPSAMLRWHYRSRHPSLIAVSNHEFYDNRLVFPPSPDKAGKDSGMSFQYVEGEYQRGKGQNNPKEADAVVAAVRRHAKEHPGESLGVVALSVAQRDTINDKLELERAQSDQLDSFCKDGYGESFFVKNLENVQGDERDVIFISIGYGKDSGGYISQSYGPVSKEGGERRLNVLFTRAKKRCRIFSSIRHTDIRLDVTKHAGPRVLRRFLKFADTGDLDVPVITGGEPDSPFEVAVAEAVQKHGYRVEGQVGSAGFKIDLAVYDPDHDGRFLLAIECDGARYHSSSWARERDRSRQVVLEGKGWKFHRIWSTDWFYNRDAELDKLLDAIEAAREPRNDDPPPPPPPPPPIERDEPEPPSKPVQPPYEKAEFSILERTFSDMHEMGRQALARYVVRVVEVEGPVHIEEVTRRLSQLWGYKRTGRRIQESVANAAACAVQQGELRFEPGAGTKFLACPDGPQFPDVRDRRKASPTARKPDMIPPAEIQAGILDAVKRNIGISPADCAVEVARMLGFKTTSATLRKRIVSQAPILVRDDHLVEVRGKLRIP